MALVDGPSCDSCQLNAAGGSSARRKMSARSVQFPERNHSLAVLFLSGWSERASNLHPCLHEIRVRGCFLLWLGKIRLSLPIPRLVFSSYLLASSGPKKPPGGRRNRTGSKEAHQEQGQEARQEGHQGLFGTGRCQEINSRTPNAVSGMKAESCQAITRNSPGLGFHASMVVG